MKVDDYQETALSTCLPQSRNLEYTTLGMMGESGELIEKFKKKLRGDDITVSDVVKEAGDVLWYVSVTAYLLSFKLSDLTYTNFSSGGVDLPLDWDSARVPAKKVFTSVSKFEETQVVSEQKEILKTILRMLDMVMMEMGLGLVDAAAANNNKLKARKDHGVLQGNGDDRENDLLGEDQ